MRHDFTIVGRTSVEEWPSWYIQLALALQRNTLRDFPVSSALSRDIRKWGDLKNETSPGGPRSPFWPAPPGGPCVPLSPGAKEIDQFTKLRSISRRGQVSVYPFSRYLRYLWFREAQASQSRLEDHPGLVLLSNLGEVDNSGYEKACLDNDLKKKDDCQYLQPWNDSQSKLM
jgi:hypothetical protein